MVYRKDTKDTEGKSGSGDQVIRVDGWLSFGTEAC